MSKGYTITINDFVRAQLNEFQIRFIEMAFTRVLEIENSLEFNLQPAHIRLFYLKELYTIFAELRSIKFGKKLNDGVTAEQKEKRDANTSLLDLEELVSFIRHIFSHFPLFKTWDQIWITKEFAAKMSQSSTNSNRTGSIYKFLNSERSGLQNVAFELTFKGEDKPRQFIIKYPKNLEPDEKVYLKDIVSEKEGALLVIAIMMYMF